MPADAVPWMRSEFAYNVIADIERDTDAYVGPEFNYWKLYMSDEPWDGKNDFTDEELRVMIDKAHKAGKIVDVHCGGHNDGLRRMLAFDVDTLEHPFYGSELIDIGHHRGLRQEGRHRRHAPHRDDRRRRSGPPTRTASTRRSTRCRWTRASTAS